MPDEPKAPAKAEEKKLESREKFFKEKIEKIEFKEHKEKPEKFEHKEKPEKIEHKEKPEKHEYKEKPEKFEIKEKPEKHEHKEKPEKHEHKEFEKFIIEKTPKDIAEGGPVTNPSDPIEQRVAVLEQSMAAVQHFITSQQRPDVSRGALASEPGAKRPGS